MEPCFVGFTMTGSPSARTEDTGGRSIVDCFGQLCLLVCNQLHNIGPGKSAPLLQRKPVLAGQRKCCGCATGQLAGHRPCTPGVMHRDFSDIVAALQQRGGLSVDFQEEAP